MKKNKVGACIWSLPGENDKERIQLAKRCGLDGVQLDFGLSADGFPLSRRVAIQEMQSVRDDTGLIYPSLGLNEFCYTSATDWRKHSFLRDVLEAAIEVAVELNIPTIQIPSFGASALQDESGIKLTAELLAFACRRAVKHDIRIASENVLSPESLGTLIDLVGESNFGIYFDTANPFLMEGMDAIALFDAALPRLVELHLKDGCRDNKPVLLGEGDTNFVKVFEHIWCANYTGWYILESPYESVARECGLTPASVIYADLALIR